MIQSATACKPAGHNDTAIYFFKTHKVGNVIGVGIWNKKGAGQKQEIKMSRILLGIQSMFKKIKFANVIGVGIWNKKGGDKK